MAKDAITTKFSIDISDFKKSITEANKQIKLANAEFKAASAGMDDWSKSSDGITAKLSQLDKVLSSQKSIFESYKQQLQAQQKAYEENGKRAEELKAKLSDLAKNGVSTASDEYKKYVSALADVTKEQGKNESAIDKLKVQMLNQEAAVKGTEKEIRNYNKSLEDVTKGEKDAAKGGDDASKAIEDTGESADKANGKLSGFAKGIATGIVAGLAALSAAAIAAAKDMISLASDVAAAGDEIDKESQKLGMSAENYQKLSYAMELSGANIDELRKGTVNITKALGAYEDEGEEAKQVDPFNKLNVSLVDAQGNLRTTDAVLLDTIDALASMEDDVQRDIIANEIFGKTFTEMRPLINGGSQAIKDLMQEAEDYGMVMSDDAVKASADFEDALTRMQGTLGGVKNRLGAELLPALTETMDGFSQFVAGVDGGKSKIQSGVKGIISQLKKMFPQILGLVKEAGAAVMDAAPDLLKDILDGLISAVPEATSTITDILKSLIDLVSQVLPGMVSSLGDLVVTLLDGLLDGDMLSGLISSVVDAIVAILDKLGEILPQITTKITEILPQIVDTIVQNTPVLLDAAIRFFSAIVQAVPEILPKLLDALPQIVSSVTDMLKKNAPTLAKAAVDLFMEIAKAMPKINAAVAKAVVELIGSIGAMLYESVGTMGETATAMFMSIADAVPSIYENIKQALSDLLDVITEVFFAPLQDDFTTGWDMLVEGAKNAWEGVKTAFSAVGDFFKGVFQNAWDGIQAIFSAGGTMFDGIQQGIEDAFKVILNTVLQGINAVIAEPFQTINDLLNEIRELDILGVRPFIGLWNKDPLAIPEIPMLAQGGVLKRGQVGLLEGSGAEAVVPLENNKAWIKAIAKEMQQQAQATLATNKNYSFVQNNYSPKALSRLDLYRQTRNQFALYEAMTGGAT